MTKFRYSESIHEGIVSFKYTKDGFDYSVTGVITEINIDRHMVDVTEIGGSAAYMQARPSTYEFVIKSQDVLIREMDTQRILDPQEAESKLRLLRL